MATEERALGIYRGLVLFTLLLAGCGSTPEEDLARYLREGQALVSRKEYSRAFLKFKNASRAMPQDPEPYYQLGITAIATGDAQSGAEFLKQALTRKPNYFAAIIALADIFTRAAEPPAIEEGKRLAQQALVLQPGNLAALNAVAVADIRLGRAQAAAVELEDVLKRNPDHVDTAINLARARLMLDKRSEAEQLLRRTAVIAVNSAKASFALGDFYSVTHNLSGAAEWYGHGLGIQPDNAQAWIALGNVYAKAGDNQKADAIFARVARMQDRRFRYTYAVRLRESGRKPEAVVEFARIWNENTEDREARSRLIGAYLEAGRLSEAETLIGRVLDIDSGDVDALMQRSRIMLMRGRSEEAEKDLAIVRARRGNLPELQYLMAELYKSRNNTVLQATALSEALRLDPRYLPARIELSRALIHKDPARGLALIDSAPVEQQHDSELQLQRTWLLIELKRADQARAAINAMLNEGGTEVLLQDAVLRLQQRDFAAGRKSAEKALTTNPGDVRALEIIMRCSVGEKRPNEGLDTIRRHAAQNRRLVGVQMFLGTVEFRAGNEANARAAWEAAKAADPQSLEADWKLIDLDVFEQKFADARKRISSLMKGASEAMATVKLAMLEQTVGNYEAAIQSYKRAVQANPSSAGTLNSLAYILTEYLGKPAEALGYAQTAKDLAPESAAIDDTLGWTYYKLGSHAEAVSHLELAAKRKPTARRIAHLAMAYAKKGDMAKAKRKLMVAIKMDSTLPEISQALRMLSANAGE